MRSVSRARWAALLGSGVLAGALGCSGEDAASAGGADSGGDDALATGAQASAAPMCELPSGGYSDACNACLAASCCEPIEACKNDGACAAQLGCIVECQDAPDPGSCSTECAAADGFHSGYVAYDDCSFARCLSTCWM